MIQSIQELHAILGTHTEKRRVALAAANDLHSLDAIYKAYKAGIIQPILVGDKKSIIELADFHSYDVSDIEIVDVKKTNDAVEASVRLVRDHNADILMKGNVPTGTLLKGVLNKEWGLRKGSLLSHITFLEMKPYHKLLAMSDVALNIAPDLKAKIGIIANAVSFMESLGYTIPKIAAITAVETVSEQMPSTMDAAVLAKMSLRGQLGNCIVDGPLAFDNAMSKDSAEHKGIVSEVAGDADLLLLPNIEAGNILYKAMAFMGAYPASIILGATAPIVLTSRADAEETKFNSLVLAAASCK